MFHRLLIANRGEIACRIIKTAKKLGLHTIAVYSDIDQHAMHADLADEKIHIGASSSKACYLNSAEILKAAKLSNAEAVHPGYGFLSENSQFAKACLQAGLIFIGPKAEVIETLGSKANAKSLVAKMAVPVLPGYHGDNQTAEHLSNEAKKLGFPLLIKAASGGGGKGMRLVEKPENFYESLSLCQNEALSSFSDARVILEKYLTHPRHIEVQIFGDHAGNIVTLFERDCSLQRRNQKIVEETPAEISSSLRQKLRSTARLIAKNLNYSNAGTVEFLVDDIDNFYFLEVNTRLQVEHGITEMITGIDLVAWQLQVAQQQQLPLTEEAVQMSGHAMELRICAEDANLDFMPVTGTINQFIFPDFENNARLDTGVKAFDEISIYYDSLLAKLMVHSPSREQSIIMLQNILDNSQITGIVTNLPFLRRLLRHPDFLVNHLNNHSLSAWLPDLKKNKQSSPPEAIWVAAILFRILQKQSQIQLHFKNLASFPSLWQTTSAFRLNSPSIERHLFYYQNSITTVSLEAKNQCYHIGFNENPLIEVEEPCLLGNLLTFKIAAGYFAVTIIEENGCILHMVHQGDSWELHDRPTGEQQAKEQTLGSLIAPMPGIIVQVNVKLGDLVKKGSSLLSLEAMKMQHLITAPFDAVIIDLPYTVGTSVKAGSLLIELRACNSEGKS